jgi:hypothetical protein
MGTAQSTHDAWSGTVRRLEDGFFIEREQLPGPGGLDFSKRVVDGIGSTTQFFCVHVDGHNVLAAPEDIWMVCTALSTGHRSPSPDEKPLQEAELAPVRASLVAALPHARFCFTTFDREGYVRVLCNDEFAPPIAAAVAVVKYYAAWDESDPISVVVNDKQFAVSVTAHDGAYHALVRHG